MPDGAVAAARFCSKCSWFWSGTGNRSAFVEAPRSQDRLGTVTGSAPGDETSRFVGPRSVHRGRP